MEVLSGRDYSDGRVTTRASAYAVRKDRHAVRFQILRPIPEIWRYAGSSRASGSVTAGSVLNSRLPHLQFHRTAVRLGITIKWTP
jgi:hypothetical protein